MPLQKKKSLEDFNIKKSPQGKQVTIEGFANKAVIDRGGDLIPGDAWDLKNFKKNPIIFFNHNKDLPIGKATSVEATKEGLLIKAAISKSENAPIPFIRDMISEGILKTFSVGFDDKQSSEKDGEGINVIKEAELFETSVVTLPMNTDSEFDLSKAANNWVVKDMSYHEAVSEIVEKCKGKTVAAKMHKEIALAEADTSFSEAETMKELSIKSQLSVEEINDIMAGNADAPETLYPIFEEVMGLKAVEKNAFQQCVTDKIPKLLEEGKSQEEAVAIAISVCQKEDKDYQVTKEDYKLFLSEANKQADQEDVDGPTFNVDQAKDETDFGSPQIDLFKSQLALSGSMLVVMKELLNEFQSMNSKFDEIIQAKDAKADSEEVETAKTSDEDEEEEAEEEEEEKAIKLYDKKLNTFKQRLAKITG